MSLESQQRELFIVVSRKRERSPSSEREESLLLVPQTPPGADKRRRRFDEEEDWGVQEWGDNYVPEMQESNKRSSIRPWWTHDDSLQLFFHHDPASADVPEDSSSRLTFSVPTTDLSTAESYYMGRRTGLLALTLEDLEDIANAASTVVTPSRVVRSKLANDNKPAAVLLPPRAIGDNKSGDPEDGGSSNLPGGCKHRLSVDEEKSVGSSPWQSSGATQRSKRLEKNIAYE